MSEPTPEISPVKPQNPWVLASHGLATLSLLSPALLFLAGAAAKGDREFGYMWGAFAAFLPAIFSAVLIEAAGAVAAEATQRSTLGKAASALVSGVFLGLALAIWWIWGATLGKAFF